MPTITVIDGDGNTWEEEHVVDTDAINNNREIEAQARLASTDWTMISDVGLTAECKSEFEAYRATIRGIRRDGSTLPSDGWPAEPEVVFA